MKPFDRPSRLLFLALLALFVAACDESEDADPSSTTSEVSTTITSTTLPPPTTTTPASAEPDVHAEIDWFVSLLNGTDVSKSEYDSRFSEEFRQQVPYTEGFVHVLDQFRPEGPFTVVERTGEGRSGNAIVESADGTRARVVVELDDENRFTTLLIQPAETPTLENPPESVDEAFDRLAEIGTVGAIAAEVVDGRCQAIESVAPGEAAPIGSIFKLYVLAGLGESVDAGELEWDDEITIQEELKSVPSGVLQNRDAGETFTVREVAELMISISDNTATDHLIDLLGRETVESVFTAYGNTTPQLNTPLLNTREFTALKVGPASGLRIQWLEGDDQTRRGILDQISAITPGDLPVQEWTEPIDPDQLEWFASPEDLCSLAMEIRSLAERVPEIGEILDLNPGIPADPGTWDTIWFKGGSEPGLVATWFVTQSGDRTFVTAGSVVDPVALIDSEEAILLFAAARDLLSP